MTATFLPIIGCRQHGEVYFKLNITHSFLNRLEYKSCTKWFFPKWNQSVSSSSQCTQASFPRSDQSCWNTCPHSLCGRRAAQACVKYAEASPEYLTFVGGVWRPVALRFVCKSTDQLQFLSELGYLRIWTIFFLPKIKITEGLRWNEDFIWFFIIFPEPI